MHKASCAVHLPLSSANSIVHLWDLNLLHLQFIYVNMLERSGWCEKEQHIHVKMGQIVWGASHSINLTLLWLHSCFAVLEKRYFLPQYDAGTVLVSLIYLLCLQFSYAQLQPQFFCACKAQPVCHGGHVEGTYLILPEEFQNSLPIWKPGGPPEGILLLWMFCLLHRCHEKQNVEFVATKYFKH